MAKRNDASKSRPTRNRPASEARIASSPGKQAGKSAPIPGFDALEDTIEEERARLMQAHSILNCVAIAMDVEDVSPADGPHYPTLIEAACDLLNESIRRLDSICLAQAVKNYADDDDDEFDARKDEVREPPLVPGYGPGIVGSGSPQAAQPPAVPTPEVFNIRLHRIMVN